MWEFENTHTHTHLQLFQLLQDHVVRHVVKQPICGSQDDVPKLDIEGGAVSSLGAGDGQRLKHCSPHRHQTPPTAHPQPLTALWALCKGKGSALTVGKAPPQPRDTNRSCSSSHTQDLHLKFPHEQSCKLICFRSVSPRKPVSRMAAQGPFCSSTRCYRVMLEGTIHNRPGPNTSGFWITF